MFRVSAANGVQVGGATSFVAQDCEVAGCPEAQKLSETVGFTELLHVTVRDWVALVQALQLPVCQE